MVEFTVPKINNFEFPTDKFSVPNTPNFTIPNINVETSKDKITPKFTMPNINVVEQPTTVSKVESTSPYDLHDLGDQEFTEDELRKNKQFLKDARTIYRNQKKKDWAGSSEDLGSWLLNRQSRVGWNLTNAGLTAFDAQTWSPEVKAAWYRSMDMYDRTDPTWRSAGKAAFWTLFDLPTIATAGWGPALRAVAGPTSNLAIRYSFKEMLKRALNIELKETFGKKVVGKTVADLGEKRVKEIRKEVAKRVAWRNALENYGTIGAAYSGLFDIAHQSLDQEVDPYKDDFDYKQFAQNSLLGYGIGGALGYTVPRVIEKFTRGKAIRNLQEEEIVREAELNPSDFNFDKHSIEQQKIAAEGNPETKIGKDAQGSSAVVDFVSKIAQIFNRKNIKPEIHDFGAGLPDDTGKIPSQKILEDAADITYTAEELAANVEKARRRKLQPYIKEGEKPTGTKQIVFASNLAGRYSSRALFGAVLDKTMPQLHPKTGMYILNTGKRATRNIGDDIVDDTGIPRKGTEQRDNVEREFIEEIIEGKVDPKTGEVSPPTVRKKEVVGLSNSDIEKLMNNRFVNVKKFKVKGETIYVGSEPRLFTPFRKFNRIAQPKSKLRTIFSFRKNWTDSDAGTPKELDYYAAAKRNSIKKSIRSIQQVLTKRYHPTVEKFWSSRVLNSDSNPARYWKDFTDPERITANRIADDFLRNTIDEKDLNKIPTEVKNELISMRKNITNLQKKLEESGYIEEGSDLMATIQSSRGENNFLGMPELYLNRQYEIYDNAPKWIRKVLASQGDPEGVYEKARSFFKKQLREDKEILKDSTYGPMAEELQALYAVKYNNKILEYTGRSPYVGKGRRWSDMTDSMKEQINNRVDEIEGGEVDNIVSHFLREYSPEELESIKRLGAQGYFQSMKAGEGSPIKGAFYARKEIPTPIRNLLGEYKNPNINYANTIMKLNQTYDNYKYEKAIQDLAQTGQFPDVILPQKDRFGNPLKTIGGRDLQEASALAQYAPGTDRPLANLKADDVIFDAIKQGNELMPILNPAFKTILGLQAATRLSKTAYSVAAFPRNFTGAMLKTLGAGNLNLMNMRHFGKIIKGLKAYTDDELSAEIEKGLHLGFLDSGARAGSLKAGLEDYFGTGGEAALTDAGVFLGKNPGDLTTGSWFMKKLSRANRRVLDAYQSMDDMWKYYSFINEKQNYRTILKDNGVDPDFVIEKWTTAGGQKVEITELDKYAARMVRDHMDNYGEVARGVKFMRRLPTADFLAYKTEQFRTTNNIFRTALRDIREGRALQKQGFKNADGTTKGSAQLLQGYKRLGSIISALGFPVAAAGTAAWALGMNEKATIKIGGKEYELPYNKIDALRESAQADYTAGSSYIPTGKQKADGTYTFLNLSYIDPWAPWREPFMAALRAAKGNRSLEETFEKASMDVGKNLVGHFGPSMFLDATLGALFNFDKYGKSYIDREDTMPKQLADRFIRFVTVFEPNAIRDAKRVHDSFKHGYTERGSFRLDPWRSIRKSVGIPSELVEPSISLPFKIAPILKRVQASSATFNNSLQTFHIKSGEDIVSAYRKTLEREYNAMNDLARLLVAAKSTGMSEKDIIAAVSKDFNFPERINPNIIKAILRNGSFLPSTLPVNKNLIQWAEHVKKRTKSKKRPVIYGIQKELNKVLNEFTGLKFPITNDLKLIEKEE